MAKFVLRRLFWLPVCLVVANFAGFAYAHFASYLQQRRNPFFAPLAPPSPLLEAYSGYLEQAAKFNFGSFPIGTGLSVGEVVLKALAATSGLLLLALGASVLVGLPLGMAAVRRSPPGVAGWLAPIATVGLAMPSFYLGAILIAGTLAIVLYLGPNAPKISIFGFGWDGRVIFPVLALIARPTVQIAQVTANVLAGELGQRYITTARAVGNTWRTAQWRHALANAAAPIVLTIAASFRLLMGEMIVVEWLFAWPGLGHLLAAILIPSQSTGAPESIYFLDPPALALTLCGFALYFLLADLIASSLVRALDPRLRDA